ncbi:ovostatin-like [Gastrophryne carolinensis]
MERRGSILSLSLLCVLASITAEPQCAVFIPALLKSGEPAKACLIAKKHTLPMDVDVNIEANGIKTVIINQQFPPGDVFQCSEFQVPRLEKASPVFLHVNATSGDYNYTNRQSVVIDKPDNVPFIITDKFKYKRGQTAQIFMWEVDNNLQPVDRTFSAIYVRDPNGNQVQMWKNQKTNGYLLNLQYTFTDEPEYGPYQIIAESPTGTIVSHTIVVEDYSLPKFAIEIEVPSRITIQDKNLDLKLNVKYMYGMPVAGNASVILCRPPTYYYAGDPCGRNQQGICVPVTGEIDSEGSFKASIDLLPFQMDRPGYEMNLKVDATVIEQGTGFQVTGTQNIPITAMMGRAYFLDASMSQNFKKNIPFAVVVMAEDALGRPQSNKTMQLQVNGVTVQNLTSDENGRAYYEIDTSNFSTSEVQLQLIYSNAQQCYDYNWVGPVYSNAYRTIRRFFSPTQTFVQLQGPREDLECGTTHSIRVRYVFGKSALEEGQKTAKFNYIAMSRGIIIESGEKSVDLSTSLQGEFNLTYTSTPAHVPTVKYIVFILLKSDMVADTTQLNLDKCFKNKVDLTFSAEMGTPGSNVDMEVKATPESVCIARVFDSSLLHMDQGVTLTAEGVYNSLKYLTLGGYNYAGYNVAPRQPPCINANEQIVVNNMYYGPVSFPQEEDTSKMFAGTGLLALTYTSYQQPQLCSQPINFWPPNQPMAMGRPGIMAMDESAAFEMTSTTTLSADVGSPAETMYTRRNDFPEVWTMQSLFVDATGSASQSLGVPGTITTWKGNAMCLSNKTGFGMTKYLANFTSFQKMFTDLSLADSIVRGENMLMVANVANYMNKCAKVRVTLNPSSDYIAVQLDTVPEQCVCSSKRVSFKWNVNATSSGVINVNVTAETIHIGETCEGTPDPNEPNRKDIIEKTFKVEFEGVKQDVTQTNFVCVKGENTEVVFNINPTGNTVHGSLKATAQVMGDIMGPVLVKSEALFNEPMGSGEQILATLNTIIITYEYLNSTDALDKEKEEKAKVNMAIGYAKLMRFRNSDGSFSVFRGSQGSAWLTLDAAKALMKLKPYFSVEERVIDQAIYWLGNLQDFTTGGFKTAGTVLNSGLQGGADDNIGFTCAMVIFLANAPYASVPTLLHLSMTYLEEASQKEQSPFNYIMLMYAFEVAGNTERANAMAEKVKALATDGETIHWDPPFQPNQAVPLLFSPPATSAAIEMTATALKAFLHGKTTSTISDEDLTYCTKIGLWLVKQQRNEGTYRSTSDTVAALSAFAVFAPFMYRKNATNTVHLKKGNDIIRTFTVDASNKFSLQTERLPSLPGEYRMEVSGTGCVLLQAGVQFYVPFSQENPAFALSLTTSRDDCVASVAPSINVQANISYEGLRNKTNMVVIDISLLSGYSVNPDSLNKLRSQFPRVETKTTHLIVYVLEMNRAVPIFFKFNLDRSALVSHFQDKTAIIYDANEKDENGSGVLRHPCTL